jgi:hypothetical protein
MRVQDIFAWRRARERDGESGAALLTVMLAGAILTAVAVVGATVSINNLKNAGRDRVAGGAMGAAEAGIAEAITYLATQGVGRITCSPSCGVANPWGNSASPQVIAFPDGRRAEVWVQVVQAFSPPAAPVGTYKIHSYGTDGSGPGRGGSSRRSPRSPSRSRSASTPSRSRSRHAADVQGERLQQAVHPGPRQDGVRHELGRLLGIMPARPLGAVDLGEATATAPPTTTTTSTVRRQATAATRTTATRRAGR